MSYQTINRWKRDYLAGGFEALVPAPRQASPRTPGEVLEMAAPLKRENPERYVPRLAGERSATGRYISPGISSVRTEVVTLGRASGTGTPASR